MRHALLLGICLLALGCTTWKDKVDAHPEWPESVKASILKGRVTPGMTYEQVQAAWGSSLKDIRYTETESSYTQTNFYENESMHQGEWCQSPRGRYVVHFQLRKLSNGKTELVAASVGNW